MKMHWTTVFLALACASPALALLEEVASWSFLSYDFSYGGSRQERNFKPENTVLTGLEVSPNKLFVAAPRLWSGVPATISTVSRTSPPGSSPLLEPFPDWSWHDAGFGAVNCSGFISVYRMRADSCGRIWILDSGIMNSIEDFKRSCPPKMVVFEMDSSRPVRSVTFPEELLRPNSLFTNLIIDETNSKSCDDVFVYISDTAAPGMIVYDGSTDSAWRVTHAAMYPDPDFSDYRIGPDTFNLMDGVVGLAMSPAQQIVYFQPLATDRTFSISTEALRRGPPADGEELPVKLVGRKSSQGLGLAVDPHSDTLFYSPLTETALAAWNPHSNTHEVLAYDPDRLQFAAEVRWIGVDGGHVWALTSRFQKFFLRSVSAAEVNHRILRVLPDYPAGQRVYRSANATAY